MFFLNRWNRKKVLNYLFSFLWLIFDLLAMLLPFCCWIYATFSIKKDAIATHKSFLSHALISAIRGLKSFWILKLFPGWFFIFYADDLRPVSYFKARDAAEQTATSVIREGSEKEQSWEFMSSLMRELVVGSVRKFRKTHFCFSVLTLFEKEAAMGLLRATNVC